MPADLKIIPYFISLFIGIAITLASLAYQKMGPETASYGNAGCEEQPNSCIDGQMMGDVLGAGFPLQYVLDNPGVSVQYSIGLEDNFKFSRFLLDSLFYSILIYESIKFARNYKQQRSKK
ncbi:MAG: hypothetical protein JNM55_02520 [Anaerolineales bacterium]|nr:hypothetical protein [Anaerolineales bacterium]